MATAKPHALLVPLPFQGHINPLLELSKKLLSTGFMVTFANTQANHQRILKCLEQQCKDNADCLTFSPATPDHDEGHNKGVVEVLPTERYVEILQQDERMPESKNINGYVDDGSSHLRLVSIDDGLPAKYANTADMLHAAISATMKASVEALVLRLLQEEHPVSCLISDVRLLFVQDIANKLALPRLAFWTQSAASFMSNLLLSQGFQPPPDDSTLITTMPTLPPHKRSEVSTLFFDNIRFPSLSDEYLWEPLQRIHEAEWVVLNTYEELEAATFDALQENLDFRPLALGPLVGTPMFSIVEGIMGHLGVPEDSSLKWLQQHPPASVLYIAFGTVATMSKEQLEELVVGLEASQQPFLWVFRPDLCKDLGDATVASLLERVKNQGMVVPWAPQWHIVCHPSVGGFLTHCGWNSMLEGIKAGVPMLGWPQLADQFLNLRCLEDQWGTGLGLKVDDTGVGLVLRAEVKNKVRKLMQGESGRQLRERASALSVAAKAAVADGGSSSLNFDLFLQSSCKSVSALHKKIPCCRESASAKYPP